MDTIDESWSGDACKMDWCTIAASIGNKTHECLYYNNSSLLNTVFASILSVAFLSIGNRLTLDNWTPIFALLFIMLFCMPFLINGPSLVNDYRYQKRSRELKYLKSAVPLNEEALEDLIFDPDIKGCVVGFAANPFNPEHFRKSYISRGDGMPLTAAYMIFDDPYDQVIFMVKHGIVK